MLGWMRLTVVVALFAPLVASGGFACGDRSELSDAAPSRMLVWTNPRRSARRQKKEQTSVTALPALEQLHATFTPFDAIAHPQETVEHEYGALHE